LPVAQVLHAYPVIAPDRVGELGQAGYRLGRAVPADRIEMEPLGGAAGALPGLAGEAGPDLDPGTLQHFAEPELLRRASEPEEGQRPGLVQADPGQPGAVAAVQAVAARRPSGRAHRYPGSHQHLIDPRGRGPLVYFQQMDAPRPQRYRIHFDVWVPHDQAEARIAAAIAAGGHLVTDEYAPSWWVLADAEGNEACVCTWMSND
jgi:hypothetical protein